jgi:hypothetical protein
MVAPMRSLRQIRSPPQVAPTADLERLKRRSRGPISTGEIPLPTGGSP